MRIVTSISLPPGPLAVETVDAVLEATLGSWITPDRYGDIQADAPLPEQDRRQALLSGYREHHALVLGQRKGDVSLEIVSSPPGMESFADYVAWEGPASAPLLERETHRDEVWRVMGLVGGAPVAYAATPEAVRAFSLRAVRDERGEKLVSTVPDYTRGLRHPHWRMWFGREYRAFLGADALAAAPAVARHDLGDGYFVELHEDPAAWDRPEGRAAAEAFAAALPQRVFYDPADPDAALDAPDFTHLPGAP